MINWGYVPATLTTLPFPVTTHAQTGASVAPSTALETADFILYKNGSATQRTSQSGWTITSPLDSIVGLHMLVIDLTDNTDAGFYSAGAFYTLVLSPDETIDSLVAVRVVGTFIIGPVASNATQWNSLTTVALPLVPTTAGRSLDVTATGAAGVDWGNLENPTTANNLSSTNIDVDQVVASVSGAVGSVTGAVGSIAAGGIAAATFAAGALDAVWSTAARTLTSFGTLAADVWAVATRVLTAGTNIVLTKGVGVTGFNDLSQAQVQQEAEDALAAYDASTGADIAGLNNLSSAGAQTAAAAALNAYATVPGQLDVNVQYVNDVELQGDGSTVPWGPV